MDNDFFRLLILVTLHHCVCSLLIVEHTINRGHSYRDCFVVPNDIDQETDDRLSYCLRIDDDLPVQTLSQNCYTGKQVTFDELQMTGVRVNDLLQWQIPLDIADLYGVYLTSQILYGNHHQQQQQFICNCSTTTTNAIGRYCEYSFDEGITSLEELISSTINEKKTFYPKDRLLTCYDLENHTERCLDYRDICDGEFDTMNGDDELYCDVIETNLCEENEFRCRNGLCIDRRFLFDGQADCTDLTDEQSLLIIKKYHNFQYCFERATIDCDEHWCGREMISCGDGECIPWNRRFWSHHDCANSYTHVYNCELEERWDQSIIFSLTNKNGRCTANITDSTMSDDPCLLMIKCAVTSHSSCQSIGMLYTDGKDAYARAYELCRNHTLIEYASGMTFLSPFVRAYNTPKQFEIYIPEFFSKMKIRQPDRFCFIGERMCRGIKVIHNGSICFLYDDIYERGYPFPPYDHLFCQEISYAVDYCINTTFFYRCRTSGECLSKHRLFDGFIDCFDASDEDDQEALHSLLPLFMRDRYNCTIGGNSSNAIMRHFLGDETSQCWNGTDEMSLSINWQQQRCLKSDDSACSFLRNLHNANTEEQSSHILRFTSLCDSFWDLRTGLDEIDCQEWICEPGWLKQNSTLSRWSGNCINSEWKCNGIWDYTDGSDEYNCNRTELFPIADCWLLDTNDIVLLNTTNRFAGNGLVECSGGIDERVTFACNDGFPLNERFLCNDQTTCIKSIYLCNHVVDCPTGEDENVFWCGPRPPLHTPACEERRLACLERDDFGPCIPQDDRCHPERTSCVTSHRDDYMCIYPRKYNHIVLEPFSPPEMQVPPANLLRSPWYCDRGLVVRRFGEFACLCPLSYFGRRCEKHSHRLTVIFTLNINDILKADLLRIIVLLLYQNITIDHVLITQHPSYTGKYRLYLNYPSSFYSNLRHLSNNYSVQIRVYTVSQNFVRLSFISHYPIKYTFLPAFRIAVVLQDKDNILETHDHQSSIAAAAAAAICHCALNSICLPLDNQHTTCICASQQYGPTCHLTAESCPVNFCKNQGTCISYMNEFHHNEFRCSCSPDNFGKRCEYKKAVLSLKWHTETNTSSSSSRPVRIVQLINYDPIKMHLKIERQHLFVNELDRIFYNDLHLPSIGLMKVYDRIDINIYLLYFHDNYSSIDLTEQNQTKCQHAKDFDLIPTNDSHQARLFVMKRYYRPCQQSDLKTTVCFYDPQTYFCFCNATTHRSLCFSYDFKYDRCQNCLNDGSCYDGERTLDRKNFICRCAPCIYGTLCEFRMDHLKYTFESLLLFDSSSTDNSNNKKTIWIYMFISVTMVTIGFFSNIMTYHILTKQIHTVPLIIIPRYIQMTAIMNQLTLICLLLQILSIVLNGSFLKMFFCKSSSYLLNCFAYTSKWYTAFLSISRSRLTNQINLTHRYTRKHFTWPLLILLLIFLLNTTEIIFHRLVSDPREPEHFVCTIEFSNSTWRIIETIFRFLMHLVPVILNTYAILTIIRTVARSKANLNKTNFLFEVWKQLKDYNEQLACPLLMIVCSTPELLMTVIIQCHEWNNVYRRSVMIATHFLSFLPQILTYNLFIQPSKTYKNVFTQNTRIGQIFTSAIRSS